MRVAMKLVIFSGAVAVLTLAACNFNLTTDDGKTSTLPKGPVGVVMGGDDTSTTGDDGGAGEASTSSNEGGSSTDGSTSSGSCSLSTSSMIDGALTLMNTTTGENESICLSKQSAMLMCYMEWSGTGCTGALSCQTNQSDFDGEGSFTANGSKLTGTLNMMVYSGSSSGIACTYDVTGNIK